MRAVVGALCALPIVAAAATVDLKGETFGSGTSKSFTALLGSVDATFTAQGGRFDYKSRDGYRAVGVSGKTNGEIDIGESIVGTFSTGVYVPYLTLAFLFDGPEFGDIQETASVSAKLVDGTRVSYSLTALFQATYEWTGASQIVENLSLPTRNRAGVWEIEDPFDGMEILEIAFTALPGACGRGQCNNQSDFSFYGMGVERLDSGGVTPVPEPGTLALLTSGLFVIAGMARRRLVRAA